MHTVMELQSSSSTKKGSKPFEWDIILYQENIFII